jgi:hypothetical protein
MHARPPDEGDPGRALAAQVELVLEALDGRHAAGGGRR